MERERNYSPKSAEQAGLTASAKPACGFQADPLLSEQYFTGRRNIRLEPEKRLMLAILEEAVYCFQDNYPAQHGKGSGFSTARIDGSSDEAEIGFSVLKTFAVF
jgi:hypothetical protein